MHRKASPSKNCLPFVPSLREVLCPWPLPFPNCTTYNHCLGILMSLKGLQTYTSQIRSDIKTRKLYVHKHIKTHVDYLFGNVLP